MDRDDQDLRAIELPDSVDREIVILGELPVDQMRKYDRSARRRHAGCRRSRLETRLPLPASGGLARGGLTTVAPDNQKAPSPGSANRFGRPARALNPISGIAPV